MKLEKKYLWLLLPLTAAFASIAQVWRAMPAIMQDEYVYSIQARYIPFAEQLYPNYLFSWLYNNTLQCGDGYYQCVKTYNAGFFLVTLLFVFLIAQRLLSYSWAIAVTTITALSSVSVYVSFFMPESMYFAFITAAIWLTLKAGQAQKHLLWLAAGVVLGLAGLIKPHAIFSLPAILVFAYFAVYRSDSGGLMKAISAKLLAAGGFLATKLSLGFAFAGVAGLSLFGTGYTGSLPEVNNGLGKSEEFVAQTVSNVTTSAAPVAEPAAQTTSGFLDVFLPHLPAHLAVIMLVGSIPMLLSFSVLADAITKKKALSAASQYQLLIGALAFSLPIVMALFEAFVTVNGDDHTRRIITRHYEFLFPLMLIAAVNFLKFVEPKLKGRLVQSAVAIAALFVAMLGLGLNLKRDMADSVLLYGFNDSRWLTYVVTIAGIALAIVWLANKEKAAKAIVFGLVPATLLFGGIAGHNSLVNNVGTEPAYFDTAGQVAKGALVGVPGEKISVVGNANFLNTTTKFWLDKPNVKDVVVADGATADVADFEDVDYVILIGNASITGDNTVLSQGDGYAVLQLNH